MTLFHQTSHLIPRERLSARRRALRSRAATTAGRSGAAAIQLALKEAASSFTARGMAEQLRRTGGDATIANALEMCMEPPTVNILMVEGAPAEYYLLYAEGQCSRKLDVETSEGHGIQIELLENGGVRGVEKELGRD